MIRERDFETLDENINNVVDYHLETEYDIKILDPNFVKLFRLAQLSVEYLLYCKQYLDHSVIILKDELRSKLEENVKLKKSVAAAEDSVKELKDKMRDNYKLFEKTLVDSHGEIHKCPYCPKSFKAAIFTNLHINRRHSNSPQVSILSPVHDQYKAETEKLHNEIKTLKERLNQTERIVRNESSKMYDSIEFRDKYCEKNSDATKNNQDKIEEEHRKYREEITNLTSMLFSEIRNLKVDDKKHQKTDDDAEKFKELLKSQENEMQRLRDQIQELLSKSAPNIESIEVKLKAQEDYWQSKIDQLESQHTKDIENLSNQLKVTQESADLMKDDYVKKIKDLEERSMDSGRFLSPKMSPARQRRRAGNFVNSIVEKSRESDHLKISKLDEDDRSDSDDKSDEVSTPTSINKFKRILVTSADVHDQVFGRNQQRGSFKNSKGVLGIKSGENEINFNRWGVDAEVKGDKKDDPSIIDKKFDVRGPERFKVPVTSHGTKETEKNRMDVTSEEESESNSGTSATETENSESESESESGTDESDGSSGSEGSTTTESEEKVRAKDADSKEDIKRKIWEAFEQKLRDLGVDPECDEISEETYRRSMEMVKHHRSLTARKLPRFEEIRRKILYQLHNKFPKREDDKKPSDRRSPLNKLMSNVKSRAIKAFGNQSQSGNKSPESHVPKLKSKVMSPERSVTNKLNIELLPKKMSQNELKHPVRQFPRRGSRDVPADNKLLSPAHERYTPSPSKVTSKSNFITESTVVDNKQLSHSYESIKDYLRDFGRAKSSPVKSPLRSPYLSKSLVASTPHRAEINVLPSHRASISDLSSPIAKPRESSLPNSPKNSKSVLKSTSGSTGSLVKKKVIFDLESMTDTSGKNDKSLELNAFTNFLSNNNNNRITNDDDNEEDNESESDYEISSISEEKSDCKIITPTNNSNILLKTAQSEKIAQISRKIESQLSLTRRKPAGAVEAIFTKDLTLHDNNYSNKQATHQPTGYSFDRSDDQSLNKVTKLPQPAPRTQKLIRSNSPDIKSADRDYNLDRDIDEILGFD